MFGLLLVAIGSLCEETASVIGKTQVARHKESIYTMGFLNALWGVLFFTILLAWRPSAFVFTTASLPVFIPRLVLEIAQAHATMKAIALADRSAFNFIRILTLPLLLGADMFLSYDIRPLQIMGITIIVGTLIALTLNHGIRKKGAGWVLFTALNAAVTITLFKYDITHYNSIIAEQWIALVVLLAYFAFMAKRIAGENPILFLKKRIFAVQSASYGIGIVVESFAYLFAPPSVIMTGKRAFSTILSILSGNRYFKEKHVILKLVALVGITIGLILLALPVSSVVL